MRYSTRLPESPQGAAPPPSDRLSPPRPYTALRPPTPPAIGVWFALLLIFVLYSRLTDYMGVYFRTSGYLLPILVALALIATAFAHGVHRVFVSRFGVLLTAFTLLVILSIPFGVWPGGSMDALTSWLKSFVFYIASAGLLVTAAHTRRALYAVGWASILMGVLSTVLSISDSGRLAGLGGTVGNANYLALFLLFGIPPCVLMGRAGRNRFVRGLGVSGAFWLSYLVFRTGSRGGLLTMLLVFLALFWQARPALKLKLALAASALLVVVVVRSPETLLNRYRTILGAPSAEAQDMSEPSASEDETEQTASAIQSTHQRRALLLEALKLTLQHPLLGVGPGMFKVAANPPGTNLFGWQETHDTYVQISSELGIPAFLIFLAILWHGLKTNFLFSRRLADDKAREDLAPIAQCLFLSFVAIAAGALFASLAYDFFFPVLAGIAVGFEPVARAALAEVSAPGAAYRPYPLASFRPGAQRSGL